MKRILLFCFALLTLQSSFAQGQFAPVGAEWWHQGKDPQFIWFGSIEKFWADRTVVTGDTVVNGIAARKLETTRYAKGISSPTTVYTDEINTSIIYDNPDTVFIFDDHREAFIPLYVYSVEEGDTVTLPIPGIYMPTLTGDTTFSFIIDSIRLWAFDTASLKTYFTRAINLEWNRSYNWGDLNWVDGEDGPKGLHLGQYSEKLGGTALLASIQPFESFHNPDAGIESILPAGKLACYSDAHYNLKMVDIACDSIENFPMTSADDVEFLAGISIYPNPATDIIHITALGNLPASTTATLFDISGRMLLSSKLSNSGNTEINIAHLPKGLYWIRISANGQVPVHRKIVLR